MIIKVELLLDVDEVISNHLQNIPQQILDMIKSEIEWEYNEKVKIILGEAFESNKIR